MVGQFFRSRSRWPALGIAVLLALTLPACSVKDLIEDFTEFAQDVLLDALIAGSAGDQAPPGPTDSTDDDDDDNDDDNDDNDDDNNDNDDDDDPTPRIQLVDGGLPGKDGAALARLPNSSAYVAAATEGRLLLYRVADDDATAGQLVATDAAAPTLALDGANVPHLAWRADASPAAIHYARQREAAWIESRIGDADPAARPSLFIADDDVAHVAYLDADGRLVHAVATDADWSLDVVAEPVDPGLDCSLAVAADGTVHVAFEADGALHQATNDGGGWTTQQLATPATLGSPRALALDAAGRPAVVYRGGGTLRLTAWDGDTWQDTALLALPQTPHDAALTIDQAGQHHLAFHDAQEQALVYATDPGGVWEITPLFAGEDLGRHCDIAVGDDGVVWISHYALESLAAARGERDAWTRVDLAGGGVVGLYASVAVDGDNRSHAAYFDLTHRRLKYARQLADRWQVEVVDQSADTGYFPSLAVDAAGFAHVAYYNLDAGALIYASNALGQWVHLTVDTRGDAGHRPSLVLDQAGRVHVLYLATTDRPLLKYATNAAGAWAVTRLPVEGSPGFYSDLALGSDGRPVVSYTDTDAGTLRLAAYNGATWDSELVDADGLPGAYNCVLVADDGGVHVLYRADQTGQLRHAYRPAPGDDWRSEVVATPEALMSIDAVLGGDGTLHVTYFLVRPAQVMYLSGSLGDWLSRAVETGPSLSGSTSLALDTAGHLHAAFAGDASLKVALFGAGAQW